MRTSSVNKPKFCFNKNKCRWTSLFFYCNYIFGRSRRRKLTRALNKNSSMYCWWECLMRLLFVCFCGNTKNIKWISEKKKRERFLMDESLKFSLFQKYQLWLIWREGNFMDHGWFNEMEFIFFMNFCWNQLKIFYLIKMNKIHIKN